ncbi:MAG: metallophosphoesterase family protein [Bellilinea sp.]
MQIGILADTHNRNGSLQAALAYLSNNGIETIFHCGDVTSIETARLMVGFTVHYVYGNGDADANAIRDLLISANPASTGGLVFSAELDGVSIAATHGHVTGKVIALAAGGTYTYVFHGHTHVQKDQMIGKTRVINPGSLGSYRYGGRTLCVLDLKTGVSEYPSFE